MCACVCACVVCVCVCVLCVCCVCADIDECRMGTSNCSQTCVNFEGGFTCGCEHGCLLDTDNRTCIPSGKYTRHVLPSSSVCWFNLMMCMGR